MVMFDGNFTWISQVSGIETEINLGKTKLYGFQRGVFRNGIEDIRRKIREEFQFPRVNVIASGGDFYLAFLVDDRTWKPDGGHHRAYAHYLEQKPLSVRVVDRKYIACPPVWIPITDLILRDDSSS